ncbi:LacI family DNA-binding transcriptional regulator [Aestuariimicrobium ganziense]|uniref:LacI family DNA-binding transcriptional regulator n=1 Tax=Aestuariimicrobium ganziense TaxID=2773677 RepID=UPI0019424D95|nr:LacI family DNA-binding transcriptional regulator [Aestuariimicrobium ganziense]
MESRVEVSGISEVARLAKVSPSTVSYALSGKRPISEATKQRISAAIDELGYQPHAGARALASQRTRTLALVVPLRSGIDLNVMMQFAAGVLTRARDHDHDVLVLTDRDETGLARVGRGRMVDGLVVMDVESADPRIQVLAQLRQPSVLIGVPDDPMGLSCVDFDFAAAARLAVTELDGRTRAGAPLALVASPPAVYERGTSFALRLRGAFVEACHQRGREAIVVPCEPTPASGRAAVAALLEATDQPGGVLIHNELAAPGACPAAREAGMASVCIEPESLTDGPAPGGDRLVIPISAQAIGAAAVDMLMDQVEDGGVAGVQLMAPRLTR